MARGFLPKKTWSAHWLTHPDFADAAADCLKQEAHGINNYMDKLRMSAIHFVRRYFKPDVCRTIAKKSYQ